MLEDPTCESSPWILPQKNYLGTQSLLKMFCLLHHEKYRKASGAGCAMRCPPAITKHGRERDAGGRARREAGPPQQRGPTAHRPDDAGGGGAVARGGLESPVARLRCLVCPILAQQAGPPHGQQLVGPALQRGKGTEGGGA